jgi:4-diphosphocytidyl-2-C-methyl-D-erythritol kinase
MKYIEIKAPAKINIGLNILNKRNDGYHNLYTLFYPLNDLYDKLQFTLSDQFDFTCNDSSIPSDENNLVVKTKILLEKHFGKKLNVKIKLDKSIPSQAGLGGGSSDAAATLISLNELFKLGLSCDQLIDLALLLGSDVPFFVKALPAIGMSRGEILEFIDLEIREFIVVINPRINISTKEAFENIKPLDRHTDIKSFISNNKLDYHSLINNLKNDFEEYVFYKYPEIKEIKSKLYEMGALFSMMSGSGSTIYGIFRSEKEAKEATEIFPKNYFCWISTPHY